MIRPALPLQFGDSAKAPTVGEAALAMVVALTIVRAGWLEPDSLAYRMTGEALAKAEAAGIKASS